MKQLLTNQSKIFMPEAGKGLSIVHSTGQLMQLDGTEIKLLNTNVNHLDLLR